LIASRPRVSVGLAVYNGERFLPKTLDSILAQTFKDFELIISDNASSDATEEICRRYAANDARIRYSRNRLNIGLSNNFNRVFHLSSGEYFRWSPADDLFAPTSLEECVDVLDNHAEVVLCYPGTVLIDSEGNAIGTYDNRLDLRFPAITERFRLVLQNIRLANVQYGLIRADALSRTSLFGAYPGSDMVLIAELALYGQFWEIPHNLFFRRMHDGGTATLNDKPWKTQQEFWNGNRNHDGFDLYYSTHRYHNLLSILRSPAGPLDKLRLLGILISYASRSKSTYLKELQAAGGEMLKRFVPERNT